jgi:hypothetical protein
MENCHKTMAANKFDFGFAVDWMRKDLSICLGEARKNGEPASHRAGRQFYSQVQKMGGALGYVEPDRITRSLSFSTWPCRHGSVPAFHVCQSVRHGKPAFHEIDRT